MFRSKWFFGLLGVLALLAVGWQFASQFRVRTEDLIWIVLIGGAAIMAMWWLWEWLGGKGRLALILILIVGWLAYYTNTNIPYLVMGVIYSGIEGVINTPTNPTTQEATSTSVALPAPTRLVATPEVPLLAPCEYSGRWYPNRTIIKGPNPLDVPFFCFNGVWSPLSHIPP